MRIKIACISYFIFKDGSYRLLVLSYIPFPIEFELDIAQLKNDRMDIESHTMTHAHLTELLSSPSQLTYEIGYSRQCLASQGYNTPIFRFPLNLGSNNPTIVNIVAKYYILARNGTDPLMFLNCKGYTNHSQDDCRTYSDNGKLNYANRYDIRSESFFHISSGHNFSPPFPS